MEEKARPPPLTVCQAPFHQTFFGHAEPRPIVGVGRGSISPDTVIY